MTSPIWGTNLPGMSSQFAFDSVGGRIRALRQVKGWTQETLAKKVHVSQPAVAQWESNTTSPGRQSQALLAEALGCTRDFLFGEQKVA